MPPIVGVLDGYWSTNVGNAYFQVAAQHLLRKAKPDWQIEMVPDVAGYAFPKKRGPANALEWIYHQQLDYVAVLGPFIRPEFDQILLKPLLKLKEQGVRLIGLGIGMMEYGSPGSNACIAQLSNLPFDLITTRDLPTYEALKHLNCPVYSGVDLGFFLPEITPKIPLRPEPYVVLNYDSTPEPQFIPTASGLVEINGQRFDLKFPEWRTKKCHSSVAFQMFDRMFLPQSQKTELAGRKIVRTDHRFNPVIERKIYCRPNTFSLDIWEPYASIYSGAELVLSNRVHACVATLSFGGTAMLFTESPRAALLERIGAGSIKDKPTSINTSMLEEERAQLTAFLATNLP